MDGFHSVKPLSLAVNNLSIQIESPSNLLETLQGVKKKPFQVLQNITFNAAPGQLIGIMGASGSGKTTLLRALAGRSDHKLSNAISFDGQPPQSFYDDGSCAFVQQKDFLMPYLTVRETLQYTAELKLPSSMTRDEKFKMVESVILELGLKDCADTLIGNNWRKGISGGEKRRVSVGCQLLLNPSLLFMDEPTTGLDAFTSINLIETAKGLSKKGRTIFITIHQPRADIFEMFDSIILLSQGKMVYSGAGGMVLSNYFKELGFTCPEHSNPADYLLNISSIDESSEESEAKCLAQVDMLTQTWSGKLQRNQHTTYEYDSQKSERSSKSFGTSSDTFENSESEHSSSSNHETFIVKFIDQEAKTPNSLSPRPRERGTSTINQMYILTSRTWRNLMRDNLSFWGVFFEVILVASVTGYIYFRLEENLPEVLTRKSAIYAVALNQCYLMICFFIYKSVQDIKVFDRERADGLYGVIPYVFAQFVSQIPFNIFFPTIYSIITYFMIGLRTDDLAIHLFRYSVGNILVQFIVVSFAQFSVAILRDFVTSSILANMIYTFFMYATGFLIQLESLPVYVRWLKNIAFTTYTYRLLASNEFSGNTYKCGDVGIPCDGETILNSLKIDAEDYVKPIYGLLGNLAVFTCLTVVWLLIIKPKGEVHAKPVNARATTQAITPEKMHAGIQVAPNRVSIKLENVRLELKTTKFSFGSLKPINTSKVLLNDISVEFPAASLSIIMGASGTGKSTLLSVLCAKSIKTGALSSVDRSGRILFNGNELKDPSKVAAICNFVQQSDDHLLPALTCRETLIYAARLRLPSDWSNKQKDQRADEIIRILGLKHCENTVVGNEIVKGLSGGEKRRLSIGIQMIADPSVLVIDEPTSGLDAFTAMQIMNQLKEIASSGRTIICSIHQPGTEIFAMFDSVMLLCNGGRVVYSGPSDSIVSYFGSQKFEIPKFCNPADFILDISSMDFRTAEAERDSRLRLDIISSFWKEHGQELYKSSNANMLDSDAPIKLRQMAPFRISFPILLKRTFTNLRRQPDMFFSRITQTFSLSLIQVIFFTRIGTNQASVQNRLGAIQQSVSVLFTGLLNCVAIFPAERSILFYEYTDRVYSIFPFFLVYSIIEIPLEIIGALLFAVFGLVVIGFNTTVTSFFSMAFSIFCIVNFAESIGIMFCTLVNDVGFSVSVTNAVLGLFVSMSGILSSNLPIFLDRINRASPVPYFTRLIAINEFVDSAVYVCDEGESCIYRNGTDVLKKLTSNEDVFSFEVDDFQYYIYGGLLVTVSYRILAFIVLKIRTQYL
ncbi:P-loop containing nucleoside triphosphate hydrolase protein [Globomyces pollinis-pini]|nr:P-loop containing nucleoside triphosphate hydrolase protein [Globomyces pollinis-pini]